MSSGRASQIFIRSSPSVLKQTGKGLKARMLRASVVASQPPVELSLRLEDFLGISGLLIILADGPALDSDKVIQHLQQQWRTEAGERVVQYGSCWCQGRWHIWR